MCARLKNVVELTGWAVQQYDTEAKGAEQQRKVAQIRKRNKSETCQMQFKNVALTSLSNFYLRLPFKSGISKRCRFIKKIYNGSGLKGRWSFLALKL